MVGNWWGKEGELEEPCVRQSRTDILVWEHIDTSCLRECHMLPAGMWNLASGKVQLELEESSFLWPSGFPSETLNAEIESQVKRGGSREGSRDGKGLIILWDRREKLVGNVIKSMKNKRKMVKQGKVTMGGMIQKIHKGWLLLWCHQCGPKPPVLPGKCSISHFNN